MNITQRQLRMFVTVASLANLSRAGQALHMSQPALSRALRAFETQLDTQLFERTTRRVQLTDAGARFLRKAQRLLEDLELASAELRDIAGGMRGTVRLAVGSAFGTTVLPDALRAFQASHPGVGLRLIDDNSGGITARTAAAEVDFGIGTPVGATDGLRFRKLLRAPIGVLANRRHFALPDVLHARGLAGMPLLKEPADTSIAQALQAHGSPWVEAMCDGIEVPNLGLQLALVRSGAGVALMSALGASHPLARGLGFAALSPAIRREIFLMRRSDRALTPAAQALAAAIMHALRQAKLHPLVKRTAPDQPDDF